ncbi:nuclear transport factor 2 family protein [uncultured Kordia sp.]|uniref:nuclear transport factor 2 family protein n=1 Tax=uncultured Kordia sp. TaxID=507699 RepID=UPI002603E86C|nr:nuclear transport factor 2 family protein [uncultured Kordia sp.]
MKKSILILTVIVLTAINATAQKNSEEKALKAALLSYIKAGDNNDTAALKKVLHPDFRVSLYDSSKDAVSILDRKTYVSFINKKKFGGYVRTPEFHSILFIGKNMSSINVTLTSPGKPTLKNFYSMVNLNGKWVVLQDFVTLIK